MHEIKKKITVSEMNTKIVYPNVRRFVSHKIFYLKKSFFKKRKKSENNLSAKMSWNCFQDQKWNFMLKDDINSVL